MKQRTILEEVKVEGNGLHTGEKVTLTLKPAPINHGIIFRRVDLYGKPEIKPSVELVTDVVRATTLTSGHAKLHTVEHVLSALHGMEVDNVVVEMNSAEPPILDGSAKHFVNSLLQAQIVEQEAEREYITLPRSICVTKGASSIIAMPYDGLKVTCTSADDRGIHTHHYSVEIEEETYQSQIAPARTFTIYEDIEELLKLGKIRGGSLDSAVVLKGDKIVSKEPLRFKEEFARHKILDILGDIVLLGKPIRAHIVAVNTSHGLNVELCREVLSALKEAAGAEKTEKAAAPGHVLPDEKELDIRRILDMLPHRYPFVMIDRVVSISDEGELIAIKNVTFNEPFFQGHFPGQPVMPGVLQVEAMAQAAGILMLRQISSENKTPFFMSCDKVKFRRAVTPGDQLEIAVKLTKNRGNRIGVAEGVCKVNGKPVSSAELMFTLVDSSAAS